MEVNILFIVINEHKPITTEFHTDHICIVYYSTLTFWPICAVHVSDIQCNSTFSQISLYCSQRLYFLKLKTVILGNITMQNNLTVFYFNIFIPVI